MSQQNSSYSELDKNNTQEGFFQNALISLSSISQQNQIELQIQDLSEQTIQRQNLIVLQELNSILKGLKNAKIQELIDVILELLQYLWNQNQIDRDQLIEIAIIGIEMQKHKKQQIIEFCIKQFKHDYNQPIDLDKIIFFIDFLNDLTIQKFANNTPDFFGQIFEVFVKVQNLKPLKISVLEYIFGEASTKVETDQIESLLNFVLQITRKNKTSGCPIIKNFESYFNNFRIKNKQCLYYIISIYQQELNNYKQEILDLQNNLKNNLDMIYQEFCDNQQMEYIENVLELILFLKEQKVPMANNYLQQILQNSVKYFKDIYIDIQQNQSLNTNLFLIQKFAQYKQYVQIASEADEKIQYVLENYIIGNYNYYTVEVLQKCLSYKYWIFKNQVLQSSNDLTYTDCQIYINFLQAMTEFKNKHILKSQQFAIRLKAFQALISTQSDILQKSKNDKSLLVKSQDKQLIKDFVDSFFQKFMYNDEHLSSTQKQKVEKMIDNSFEDNILDKSNSDFEDQNNCDTLQQTKQEEYMEKFHDQLEYFCKQVVGFLCAIEKFNQDQDDELENFIGYVFMEFFQISKSTNNILKILYSYLKNIIKRDLQRTNKLFWKLYMYIVFKMEFDNKTIYRLSQFFKKCWVQFYDNLQNQKLKREDDNSQSFLQKHEDMIDVYKKFLTDFINNIEQVEIEDFKSIYFKVLRNILITKKDIGYNNQTMNDIFDHFLFKFKNEKLSRREQRSYDKSCKYIASNLNIFKTHKKEAQQTNRIKRKNQDQSSKNSNTNIKKEALIQINQN